MLRVKAFQFGGPCEGCGRSGKHYQAVAVETSEHEAWYCIRCAKSLSLKVQYAITEAAVKVRTGHHYRHEAWVRKPNALTLAARG
jgi:hypothetical protein